MTSVRQKIVLVHIADERRFRSLLRTDRSIISPFPNSRHFERNVRSRLMFAAVLRRPDEAYIRKGTRRRPTALTRPLPMHNPLKKKACSRIGACEGSSGGRRILTRTGSGWFASSVLSQASGNTDMSNVALEEPLGMR